MDSVSVISLSSTSTRSSRSQISVLTVSSESPQVPVSWESDKAKKTKANLVAHEQIPNHSEKVNSWMNSCESANRNDDSFENSNECSKSTCIRYDFDKSPRVASIPESSFTRTTPLFSYMEEAKKNASSKDNLRNARAKSADPHIHNGNNLYKSTDIETPLSPESHKKELCSYLQLMKPEDKEHTFLMEHRRSGRVRNLLQSIERKGSNDKTKIEVQNEPKKTLKEVNQPTIQSSEELNISGLKVKKLAKEMKNEYMPLPPKRIYSEVSDFEDSVKEIVKEQTLERKNHLNGSLRKVEKRRKFRFGLKKFKKVQFIGRRITSLRSKGRLRNMSLDTLILRKSQGKSHMKKKARKKALRELKGKTETIKKPVQMESPRCEIISVHTNSDDENIDLKNFVDDMLELDKMSEQHRKSVIESRILASTSITNLINKRGQEADVQKAYKIFSNLSNERKNVDETENNDKGDEVEICDQDENVKNQVITEHDYANFNGDLTPAEEEEGEDEESDDGDSLSPVPKPDLKILPVRSVAAKSLHRSLTLNHKRKLYLNNYGLNNWSSNSDRKLNHSISIKKQEGAVLRAFYQDFNLVIAQQNSVSFWTQSALGNVLGAQNMWIPKGQIQRIPLNSNYTQKNAMEMLITTETSIAYVELWTKEHKSDVREVPVADVFATVYFWRLRQNGLDKKALQLENIKGFADDVQYCVVKCCSRIIVSWHSVQGGEKKTKIRSYHLAADFQTVANISEIQPVEHYVSSLHNIGDCDNLVMGFGENKVTLWNVEYGYIIATIEMSSIKSPLSTLWVKCDRGFLFTIQQCVDQELRLIAINGMNHSWKKLQNYSPSAGFDRLKGVCVENGIVVAYYAQGILCWNAQSGELIVEEVPNETEYIPCGKHVIMIVNESIIVRHSLSHLITDL